MDEDAMCREKKHRKQCLGKDNEFSFRCVENEVSVRHQDRAALQKVEERSGDQWEVWAEDRKL